MRIIAGINLKSIFLFNFFSKLIRSPGPNAAIQAGGCKARPWTWS